VYLSVGRTGSGSGGVFEVLIEELQVLLEEELYGPVYEVVLLLEGKGRGKSYIAQYPVPRTAQSTLYSTSLVDLLNQTPSQLLREAINA